jgi:hypothetical protein
MAHSRHYKDLARIAVGDGNTLAGGCGWLPHGEPYALLAPGSLLEGLRYTSDGNTINLALGMGPIFEMLGWQIGNLAGLGMTWPLALMAFGGLAVMLWHAITEARHRLPVSPQPGQYERRGAIAPPLIVLAAIGGLILGLARSTGCLCCAIRSR